MCSPSFEFSLFTIDFLLSDCSEESSDTVRDSSGSEGYVEVMEDFHPVDTRSSNCSSLIESESSEHESRSPLRNSSLDLSDHLRKHSKMQKVDEEVKHKGLLIFKLS